MFQEQIYNISALNISIIFKLLSENKSLDELAKLFVRKMNNDTSNQFYNTYAKCAECDWVIQSWAKVYAAEYHAYFAFVVCVFGTVANIINIAVLTRKEMAAAPINRILTGLAVADMMVMLEYKIYAYYYHIELPKRLNFPYWGAAYMLFHIHFTQVFHTISICLTLTLAIWRYMAIGYPERSHVLCSDQRCTLAIILSYILPVLLCSPTFFALEITSKKILEDKIYILYHTDLSKMAKNNETYLIFNFWMYAVVIKLIPCLILTVISCWLIRTLFKAKRRKQILRGYNVCPTISNGDSKKKPSKAERRADRTTKMLVAIMLLFLITEFPQGIFALMIGLRGECFFLKCYQDFGEIMDILALLYGSINFVLYCCMNRMFRATFGQLFRRKILDKWSPPAQSEIHTTTVANGTNTTEL